jgi:nucleotide-binding universal stress UspA family protein
MTVKPIVAATDGSEHSLRAVEWAAREAELHGAGLRIVSVAAMPPRMMAEQDPEDIGTVATVLRRSRDEALEAAAGAAATVAPGLVIDTDDLNGPPAEAIVASGSGALMLVLGSKGLGAFAALVLGSVSRYAAAHAPCPAVVVRDAPSSPHGLVVVGLRDLDTAPAALTFAFEEAAARKASVTVAHVRDSAPAMIHAEEEASGQLADWRRKYPDVTVTQDVVQGHPGQALVDLSARADLVVVGRRAGHSGRPGPGAVRNALLHHGHGAIAVVPSAEPADG